MPKENKIRILYVQPGKYPEERIIDNTLKAYQSLVYGDIESVAPWRTNVRVVCNQEGKLNGMPPNRLLGDYDILMGSFFICGLRNGNFISLTDEQSSAMKSCTMILSFYGYSTGNLPDESHAGAVYPRDERYASSQTGPPQPG